MLIYLQAIESQADRDKFQALYERYRGLMFHRAMLLLGQTQDAEDAVHQAFLAILEHLDKISDVDCPKTRAYIVIITESKAIDLLRLRKRMSPDTDIETIPGPEIPIPGGSDLARAMSRLPARYRQVLLLRFDMSYNTRELSRLFGITQGAVQKLIWRAREALRQQLAKEVEADAEQR